MNLKRFTSKTALINIVTGAALGALLGIAAAVRNLTSGRQSMTETLIAPPPGTQPADALPQIEATSATPGAADRRPIPTETPATPRPGWVTLPEEHLPEPTYWPVVFAVGTVLIAWGIVTTFIISAVGLILFVLALAGWIGELRHGD